MTFESFHKLFTGGMRKRVQLGALVTKEYTAEKKVWKNEKRVRVLLKRVRLVSLVYSELLLKLKVIGNMKLV